MYDRHILCESRSHDLFDISIRKTLRHYVELMHTKSLKTCLTCTRFKICITVLRLSSCLLTVFLLFFYLRNKSKTSTIIQISYVLLTKLYSLEVKRV